MFRRIYVLTSILALLIVAPLSTAGPVSPAAPTDELPFWGTTALQRMIGWVAGLTETLEISPSIDPNGLGTEDDDEPSRQTEPNDEGEISAELDPDG
jgi:hypothetical protein